MPDIRFKRVHAATRRLIAGLALGTTAVAGTALPAGIALAASAGATTTASAQFDREDPVIVAMKRQTLARLMKPVTVELDGQRLEDVVQFIADVTQADITPLWIDDRNVVGLDKDTTITANAKNASALQLLEIVLDKAAAEGGFDEGSWQFSKYGNFEFGPKERLNRRKKVVLYDINDLLIAIPDYDNAPAFDLNTVFQQAGQQGGGGGGQSPFQVNQQINQNPFDRQAKIDELTDLIITTVEPDQWVDNGGEAATIREFRGNLFINAPDYVHRQLFGYQWWSGRNQTVKYVNDRRYVTLDGSYDFSETGLTNTIDVEAVP